MRKRDQVKVRANSRLYRSRSNWDQIQGQIQNKIIAKIKYNRKNQGQGKIYDQPPGQNKIEGQGSVYDSTRRMSST